MESKLLVLFLFKVASVFCLNNNAEYCIAHDDQYGITIADEKGSTLTDRHSQYLSSTIVTSLTFPEHYNWKKWRSTKYNHPLNIPVIDKRWETFSFNHSRDFYKFFASDLLQPVFYSVETNRNIATSEVNQWHHLMLQNNIFYNCTGQDFINCSKPISDEPVNFYLNKTKGAIWKLHEYYYFHTNAKNVTEKIYENSQTCDIIVNGCLTIHFVACTKCHVILNLTAGNDNKTQNIKGTGSWHTYKIPLDNFTSCFTLDVTTGSDDNERVTKLFWAFGDVMYISIDESCNENKRYIAVNSSEINAAVRCKNSFNKEIKFSSTLLNRGEEPKVQDTPEPDDTQTFSIPLYLLIILIPLAIPVIVGLSIFVLNCQRSTNYETDEETVDEALPLEAIETPNSTPIENICPPPKESKFGTWVKRFLRPNI